MSKEHTDEDNKPTGTDTDVSATQPKGSPAANDQDVQNVVSQRDRANEEARKLKEELADRDERLARLEMAELERDKQSAISKFLKENKDKYPDLEPNDLIAAEDPRELDELAKKKQDKYSAIEQRALAKLQVADDKEPTLDEIKAAEKKILENPDETDKFEKVMDQRLSKYNK